MATHRLAHRRWQLDLPGRLYDELYAHLFPGDGDEHGAVIAAGLSERPDGSVHLLAREIILAEDGIDYVAGKRGYRMLTADFVLRQSVRYRREKLCYLAVHNHGPGNAVSFSPDDLASHERGYPALVKVAQGRPTGALVFATEAVAGDIWLPGGSRVALDCAVVVGQRRLILRPKPVNQAVSVDPMYDRQARLFGDAGQEILRQSKVAIIGLGGVGSLLAEYLGRLGIGRFVLIDPERVDPTNLPRLSGARRIDAMTFLRGDHLPAWLRRWGARLATKKVYLARRVIRQANPSAEVDAVFGDIRDPAVAAKLLDCDYLFLAADMMTARLIFNQIVHQHLIPGVQIGSKVAVDKESGTVTNAFSVVRPVTPDFGCLWCNELILPDALQKEAETEEVLRAQRYVDEPEVVAPSVIALNGIGAAHAVNDFMCFMTGLAAEGRSPHYMRHGARERATQIIRPKKNYQCPECGRSSFSRFGRGDDPALNTWARSRIR